MSDTPRVVYQQDDVNGFRIVRKLLYGREPQFIVETCDKDAMGTTTWRQAGVLSKPYDGWDTFAGPKHFIPSKEGHLLFWLLERLTNGGLKVHDGELLPAYQVETMLRAETV